MAGSQEHVDTLLARRVLIVDDNDDCREALAAYLSLFGYTVRTAADAAEALQIAAEFRPAIVLLDVCMPDMDGLAVCARLRQMQALAGVTIYALTALEEHELRNRGPYGFDGHYMKPVDFDRLTAALAQLLCSPEEQPTPAAERDQLVCDTEVV